MSKPSPTKQSWLSMKQRCRNPNTIAYKNYGGRGIDFCESWSSFDNFLRDMGERPQGTTLDRTDNSKGYSKENCRWTSRSSQLRNRRPYSATGEKYITVSGNGFRVGVDLKLNGKRTYKYLKTLVEAISYRDELLEKMRRKL